MIKTTTTKKNPKTVGQFIAPDRTDWLFRLDATCYLTVVEGTSLKS
jgi:hypothetical protein